MARPCPEVSLIGKSKAFGRIQSLIARVKDLDAPVFIAGESGTVKATVIQADLRYVGSITIDQDLIDKSNLGENENVLVVDRTNGNRLETYVIKGEPGSGTICMNGAAAHLITQVDPIDIMAFTFPIPYTPTGKRQEQCRRDPASRKAPSPGG